MSGLIVAQWRGLTIILFIEWCFYSENIVKYSHADYPQFWGFGGCVIIYL